MLVCYSPHAGTTEVDPEPVQRFYADLSAYIEGIGRHAFLCLLGDWNARLGRGTSGTPWVHDDTPNANAPHFLEFLQRHELFSANTSFQKRHGKLWTHESNGHRSQLDHLVFRRRYRHSVDNAEAYSRTPFATDHRLVMAPLRLRLRASLPGRAPPRPNWQALAQPAISERFLHALDNQLAAEQLLDEASVPRHDYTRFVSATAHAAAILPPALRTQRTTPWVDERIVARRRMLHRAQREHRRLRTPASLAASQAASKALADQYATNQTELVQATVAEIGKAAERGHTHVVWKAIDELTGRKTTPRPQIPAESPAERLEGWRAYFQQLLNQPAAQPFRLHAAVPVPPPATPYTTGDITLQEVEAAAKATPLRKACGDDGVPPEVLRLPHVQRLLLPILQQIYRTGMPPTEFLRNKVIPLPKSGDTTRFANYRGITLMSCAAKLFNRVLLNRLRKPLESILHKHQHGFRPGCRTAEPVLALRRAIEEITRRRNRGLVVVFVDFLKAFDSVSRDALFCLLPAYGVPDELITAIKCIYDGSTSFVSTLDGNSASFPVTTGVLQGDTLAPLLFIVVLDYALRVMRHEAADCGLRVPGGDPIADLAYADDVALLGTNDEQAQRLVSVLEQAAALIGLRINFPKSKVMRLGLPASLAARRRGQAAPAPTVLPAQSTPRPPTETRPRPLRGPMDRFVTRARPSDAQGQAAAAHVSSVPAVPGDGNVPAVFNGGGNTTPGPAAATPPPPPAALPPLLAGSGALESVSDFSYLGTKVGSLADELQTRIARAWHATDRLWRVWKSGIDIELKRRFFNTAITPILLHGGECWPLRVHDEEQLDGAFTRLLRKALNVSWRAHTPNVELYGDLLRPSQLLRQRRLRFAGHCSRRHGWPVARLLWWTPTDTHVRGGHSRMSFLARLKRDTGRKVAALKRLSQDRDSWGALICAGAG